MFSLAVNPTNVFVLIKGGTRTFFYKIADRFYVFLRNVAYFIMSCNLTLCNILLIGNAVPII